MSRAVTSTGAVTALALCGSWQAANVFVPGIFGPGGDAGRTALRGTGASDVQGAPAQQASSLGAATGILTVGAALSLAGRRSRTARSVEVKAAAEAAAEAVPPPPPPFDPAAQLGATAPLGFFDPLGFTKKGDEEGFRNLRVAEVKHGRVAMMAALGAVVQHFVQFPGFTSIPKGLSAVATPPGTYGFVALFVVSGALELLVWKDDPTKKVSEIGDFGNPLGLPGMSEDMKNRELNNGRAAMFAALGIVVAELATGKDAIQQLGA